MSFLIKSIDKSNDMRCDEIIEQLSDLLFSFRHELALLKNKNINFSVKDAKDEVFEYFQANYEIFYCLIDNKIIAYMVLKIFDDTVWIEQLFTQKNYRRHKIAQTLLNEANNLASQSGKETAFVNVHPNNVKMINFLQNNNYTVLNLLEVRKKYNNEILNDKINVSFKNQDISLDFDY